jgi:hypothetical protein
VTAPKRSITRESGVLSVLKMPSDAGIDLLMKTATDDIPFAAAAT